MERYLKEGHKKEYIKRVAMALFAKNGFEKTSIMEICNAANANNTMVSYYFGGKMALYKDIIEDSLQYDEISSDSKEVIYIALSIIAQITFPQILSGLSFALLKQRYFGYDGLEIIRENFETYILVIVDKYLNMRESPNTSNGINYEN